MTTLEAEVARRARLIAAHARQLINDGQDLPWSTRQTLVTIEHEATYIQRAAGE